MTINEALDYDLKNLASLTALVGKRIYEIDVPENISGAYLVWYKISDPRINGTNTLLPVRNVRFQFSCFGFDKFTPRNIINVLDLHYRKMGTLIGPNSDFEIMHTEILNELDFGKDGDLYRVDLDIKFKYKES